ncbi:MAG TPA: hypothetical protein VKF81_15510 [Blastocatellia bacterium]|nr:hypothetical protein [Blastocatellia bacterium]
MSAGTIFSATSEALPDVYRRNGDSPATAESHELCIACNGTGLIAGLSDYPGSENRHFCSHCETGRRVISRILEIAAQTRTEERARRNGYQH